MLVTAETDTEVQSTGTVRPVFTKYYTFKHPMTFFLFTFNIHESLTHII